MRVLQLQDGVSNDFLNRYFRGKAQWCATREPAQRAWSLSFQCTRATPIVSFTDALLEDAEHASKFVLDQALRIYDRHHRVHAIRDDGLDPIAVCANCRNAVTIADESRLDQDQLFEYSERQAVLWMERANGLRG